MGLKDVLVHLDSGPRAAERLVLSAALARRHGARLTGLFAESGVFGQSLVGRRDPDQIAKAVGEAKAAFEAKVAEAGIASRWWQLEAGEYADVVGSTVVCCRHVDLAVFGQERGEEAPVPPRIVEQVIADSGRPVLVVPSIGRYPDCGRRVVVAWTGSREAARALHDALPLMEGAESVTVLSLQLPHEGRIPGALPHLSVVEHLRVHGVEAVYQPCIVGDDLGAVDQVLNRASDEGADLVVMGAYGLHGISPLKRTETTRAILETMTTPVLLAC